MSVRLSPRGGPYGALLSLLLVPLGGLYRALLRFLLVPLGWLCRTFLSLLLVPLGGLYGAVMGLRRWLYQRGLFSSHQLPGFVLSVGNIEAGGTGKSPVVMALAAALLERGARPAILTRGYRSGLGADESAVLLGSRVLLAPASGKDFHADEALMQAQRLQHVPVIIGSKRWAAAQRYLLQHPAPTHWILDDGFQHLRLQRQLDIVLLDAHAPFANGRCLPAGRLRETPATLKNADVILLTRAVDAVIPPKVKSLAAKDARIAPVAFQQGQPQQMAGPSRDWSTQTALVLALGIAQPARILEYCAAQRIPISGQLLVGDHELFPSAPLQRLTEKAGGILTTEKDYWRQAAAFQALQKPVYILPLELSFLAADDLSNIVALFTLS